MFISKAEELKKPKVQYQPWAKGVIHKGKVFFHPYLKVGFKFN